MLDNAIVPDGAVAPDQTVVIRTVKVLRDAPVNLDVKVGDGQAGGIAAYLGNAPFAQDPIRLTKSLGTGADLIGKVLVIATVAVDVQPETNEVSVTTTLDGVLPGQSPITQEVEAKEGGAAHFLTVIKFVDGAP